MYETILKFYEDEAPYNLKQEKIIQYSTYDATVSYDLRSLAEKNSNKLLYMRLSRGSGQGNIIIKLQLF